MLFFVEEKRPKIVMTKKRKKEYQKNVKESGDDCSVLHICVKKYFKVFCGFRDFYWIVLKMKGANQKCIDLFINVSNVYPSRHYWHQHCTKGPIYTVYTVYSEKELRQMSGLICLPPIYLICQSVEVFQDIFVSLYKCEIDLINLFCLTFKKHRF